MTKTEYLLRSSLWVKPSTMLTVATFSVAAMVTASHKDAIRKLAKLLEEQPTAR